MSRLLIILICFFSIVIAFSCNSGDSEKTIHAEPIAKTKKDPAKIVKKAKKTKKPVKKAAAKKVKKEYFFDGKKRPRHYVDGIAEKLELTDIQRDRLYLVFKTYHFKKQYAESDEEFERYNDMQQEAFQNIVGFEKYQKFIELRDDGNLGN